MDNVQLHIISHNKALNSLNFYNCTVIELYKKTMFELLAIEYSIIFERLKS